MIAALAVAASCKKSSSDNPGTTSVSKIKTVTQHDTSGITGTQTYIYDNSGKLLKATTNDGSVVFDLTYSAGKVEMNFYAGPGMVWMKQTFLLNQSGLAASATYFINMAVKNQAMPGSVFPPFLKTMKPAGDTTHELYFYDNAGYKIKEINWSKSFRDTTVFEVLYGNTIMSIQTDGEHSDTTTFEYYADRTNTLGTANCGVYFFGTQDKNLLYKIKSPYSNSTYTYEYDSRGRVIKEMATGFNSWYSYTYTD